VDAALLHGFLCGLQRVLHHRLAVAVGLRVVVLGRGLFLDDPAELRHQPVHRQMLDLADGDAAAAHALPQRLCARALGGDRAETGYDDSAGLGDLLEHFLFSSQAARTTRATF
jgi:hypothetical protein